jgi:hypothetical protein
MADQPSASARQAFIDTFDRETATTLRVLSGYPPAEAELKPAPVCKSARELVWTFSLELALGMMALQDKLDMSGGMPPAPAGFDDVLSAFEKSRNAMLEMMRSGSADQFAGTVQFLTGPGQFADWDKMEFLWFLLHDHIHHRGQLSVYQRMAGGKLPSIYGPTADEPWY